MNLCRLRFPCTFENREAVGEGLSTLATFLSRNGQILGPDYDYLTGCSGSEMVLTCRLPIAESLDEKHRSDYVRSKWVEVEELCGAKASLEVGPTVAPAFLSDLSNPPVLLLGGRRDSALNTLEGEIGVPLFLLPWHADLREGLYGFHREYCLLSKLEADCGSLEFESYRELAEPFSRLNLRGRSWARNVEKTQDTPVYYLLVRHYGYENEEPICPGCGQNLLAREGERTFLCEPCRLATTRPGDRGDDYRAYLGTWGGFP